MRRLHLAVSAAILAMGVPTLGAGTWDGGTPASPDTGGNWSVAANWDDDAVPTSTTAVVLPTVTDASTRVVTLDLTPTTTISSLTMNQSGTAGVNKLSLGGGLTLTAAAGPLTVSLTDSATVANVQIDLNGYKISVLNHATIGGTVNFNAAGSTIRYDSTGHQTMTVAGALNVTADGFLGRETVTNATGNPAVTLLAGSSLNITNNAVFRTGAYGRGSQNRTFSLGNSGSITVAAGSTLRAAWDLTTQVATSGHSIAITNQAVGTVSHGGEIAVRPYRGSTTTVTPAANITSHGAWTVAGTGATIKRLTSGSDSATPVVILPTFSLSSTGLLKGTGASDALEFNEEIDTDSRMTVTNNGTIAPGAGVSSVGTLALRDINVTFGATGKLALDVGGTGTGQYDVLALETGNTDPAGAGTLDLSAAGDTLAVTLINGFTPSGNFAIPILTYGTVNGGFDLLTLNGLTDNAATYNDGVGIYSLSYGGGSANLVYTVPEPGTAGLLLTAGLALLRRRRRA